MQTVDSYDTNQNWKADFLRILNNKPEKGLKTRRRGFFVMVRRAQSLQPLQDLCFSKEQQWNRGRCLTMRYRQGPGSRFGTLIGAFLNDLRTLGSDGPTLRGDLQPSRDDDHWRWALQFVDETWSIQRDLESGVIRYQSLQELLKTLAGDSYLQTGDRLILFSEGIEPSVDPDEWRQAMTHIVRYLPERVGLVVSGVPDGFELPTGKDDPHFMELSLPDIKELPQRDGGVSTLTYMPGALDSDHPAEVDQLGVERYASALAEFVLHTNTKPLTIGIHGEWGKGKSSFMGFVERALIMQAPANQGEPITTLSDIDQELRRIEAEQQTSNANNVSQKSHKAKLKLKCAERKALWKTLHENASADVICVPFNAWRYEDARQIWAGLASVITHQLENQLSLFRRLFLPVKYAWSRNRRTLIWTDLVPLLVAIIFTLVVWGISGSSGVTTKPEGQAEKVDNPSSAVTANKIDPIKALAKELKVGGSSQVLSQLLPATSTFMLLILFVWRSYLLVKPVSQRIRQYNQMPNYRNQLGYQHKVLEDISFVYNQLTVNDKQPRVVIFIDDLDRCSDDKVMEILQAIHLILGANNFYVFLGIDTAMIYRAINSHYQRSQSGGPLPKNFARKYLRKIIQLSFHLPNATKDEQARLIGSLFSKSAIDALRSRELEKVSVPGDDETGTTDQSHSFKYDANELQDVVVHTIKDVEDTADELEAFIKHDEYIADNAREVKRLVNVHRLVKILLQRAGVIWTPEQQRKLIKWLVFCTKWPDLIGEMFRIAEGKPDASNCFLELYKQLSLKNRIIEELKHFALNGTDYLSSSDLLEEQHLHLTAEFTQMFQTNLELVDNEGTTEDVGEKTGKVEEPIIVGNSRSHIYHLPGCPGYERVPEECAKWFCTEAKAIDAGYRKARNCNK